MYTLTVQSDSREEILEALRWQIDMLTRDPHHFAVANAAQPAWDTYPSKPATSAAFFTSERAEDCEPSRGDCRCTL